MQANVIVVRTMNRERFHMNPRSFTQRSGHFSLHPVGWAQTEFWYAITIPFYHLILKRFWNTNH